jgi:hypothetical protein
MQLSTPNAVLTILALISTGAVAQVPAEQQRAIDRIVGARGTYIADDRAYRVFLPREAATIVQDYQTLSPNLGLNSWVTFSPAIHQEAILAGQFLLLDDEVNAVLVTALESGLEVTGLAASSLFDQRPLYALDISGRGTFQQLASAFRKGMDEIVHVRRARGSRRAEAGTPSLPLESAIDSRPLDAALSMRGTVNGGAYRAAIGKRAIAHGEVIGREMGVSTWFSFAGTNDRAVAYGEFVEDKDDLQKVLRALTSKGIRIASIRNHMIGEEPQLVFVRFWTQGPALELAKALRYALDVEVGAVALPDSKR